MRHGADGRRGGGIYTLQFERAGFEPKELQIQIEDGSRIALGQIALELGPMPPGLGDFEKPVIHETKLDSAQKRAISGTAREGAGALRKLPVRLRGPGTSGDVVDVRTDENGGFRFDGIPPGSYELLVPDAEVKLKLQVRSGRALEVRLAWKNPRSPCL